jgi:hypothetical protein
MKCTPAAPARNTSGAAAGRPRTEFWARRSESFDIRSAIIEAEEVAAMKSRCGYKGYIIEARSHELRDGGFSVEFSIEERDGTGVTETQFYLPDAFPTQESAIEAGIQAGRQKVDVGFEPRRAVVNG